MQRGYVCIWLCAYIDAIINYSGGWTSTFAMEQWAHSESDNAKPTSDSASSVLSTCT